MSKRKNKATKNTGFEKLSSIATRVSGSTPAFIGAISIILIWLLSGPFFKFSELWFIFINTITTIITFLMVFIIQKAQNKDALAIQLKLNELIAAHHLASNMLVNAEDMTEEELRVMQKFYTRVAEQHRKGSPPQPRTIDELKRPENKGRKTE